MDGSLLLKKYIECGPMDVTILNMDVIRLIDTIAPYLDEKNYKAEDDRCACPYNCGATAPAGNDGNPEAVAKRVRGHNVELCRKMERLELENTQLRLIAEQLATMRKSYGGDRLVMLFDTYGLSLDNYLR